MQGAQERLLLQNYGEHGRELITVEVALRLLQTLADPSAELQVAEKLHGLGRPDLQATLHNTVFKVGNSHTYMASSASSSIMGLLL